MVKRSGQNHSHSWSICWVPGPYNDTPNQGNNAVFLDKTHSALSHSRLK